jgi:fructosamine-3-kinase
MRPPDGFRAALEAAYPDAGLPIPRLIDLEPVSGGSINQAFRMRTSKGFRFCKWNPAAPAGLFRREAEGLAALAAAGSSLIIPRVEALTPERSVPGSRTPEASKAPTRGMPGGPSLLVLEYLEPDPDPSPEAWERFGRGLAELHRCGKDRFGFEDDNFCGLTPQENTWTEDWAGFYGRHRIGALADRLAERGELTPAQRGEFGKLQDRLPGLLGHHPPPALIHGDLWSGNAMLTSRGPALVDPACSFSDREAEWGMMLLFGGFPDRVQAAYEEAWPMPGGWRERIPLYQLYHVLNHFLLFGGGYGGQALRLARKFV